MARPALFVVLIINNSQLRCPSFRSLFRTDRWRRAAVAVCGAAIAVHAVFARTADALAAVERDGPLVRSARRAPHGVARVALPGARVPDGRRRALPDEQRAVRVRSALYCYENCTVT